MATPTSTDARIVALLRLADDALILGHRLSEWCGHGPILEQDIALTNHALDLIGRARALYTYAGEIEDAGHDEDWFAYRRDAIHFHNALLVEQPNGDFAQTIARQFLYDRFAQLYYRELATSSDARVAAIAAKSLKEIDYHVRFSSEWVIRLGDGTDESKARMQRGLDELWRYTGELFAVDDLDRAAIERGFAVDASALRDAWNTAVEAVLAEATLTRPEDGWPVEGGRVGRHTEHLGYILADLQFLQRAYPDATW